MLLLQEVRLFGIGTTACQVAVGFPLKHNVHVHLGSLGLEKTFEEFGGKQKV